LGWKFREQFMGEAAVVLLENDNGRLSGRSERYFTVHLENRYPSCRKNDLARVRLTGNSNDGMTGQMITTER
jgi:hypothetical protein